MIILTVAASVKQTVVSLKGTEGTLRMYSIQTQNENVKTIYREAKDIYEKDAEKLNSIMKKLKPYLLR